MYGDVSLFENLSTELIREIFDYLTPHHLLDVFENLNSRFLSIITQHAFCLPKIDHMSRQLYQYYVTYILPKYAPQFRSLYFSDDPTIGAIDEFLQTINSNLYPVLAMSLCAIKIFDITDQTFQSLINHFQHFHHVHTLLIELHDGYVYRGDNNQQNYYLYGEFYLPLILKTMPQLQSLSMYQKSSSTDPPFVSIFNTANFPTAHHLHTLRMSGCSSQFLISLLNSGHVPRLRYLRVNFDYSSSWPMPNDDPKFLLSHRSIPELRQVYFKLGVMNIGSVLMVLTDVYRYGHLEKITLDRSSWWISGNRGMVSAQDLHRWLLHSSSSKSCFFQLRFNVKRILPPTMSKQTILDRDLVDFETLLNASISVSPEDNEIYHEIFVSYPTFIKKKQVKLEEDPMHLQEFLDVCDSNSTDMSELINVKQKLMNVERFPNLKCLSFINPCYETNMNECIQTILPLILHIIDRAPRLEKFYVHLFQDPTASIAMWLSEMGVYNRLPSSLKRQFKNLEFKKIHDDLPFLDLVQLLTNLFSGGNLEKLTFSHCSPSNVSQTFDSFQQAICLLVERLPKLIYLNIYVPSLGHISIDQVQLIKWLSGEIEPKLARYCHWRYRNETLDFWF